MGSFEPYETGQTTEVIDLEDPSFSCTNAKKFPIGGDRASGALLDNELMICGGWHSKVFDGITLENSCYVMQYEDDPLWIKDQSAILNNGRFRSGSVVLNNQLVMAGGEGLKSEGTTEFLTTIELVSPEAGSRTLTSKLPMALSSACIVPWDANSVMVIGGLAMIKGQFERRRETYIIDIFNDEIKNGPSMVFPRQDHACQEIVVKGEVYIVVVGGNSGLGPTTEYLVKSNLDRGWSKGK